MMMMMMIIIIIIIIIIIMGLSSLSFLYNSAVKRGALRHSIFKLLLLTAELAVLASHTPPFLEYGLSTISHR